MLLARQDDAILDLHVTAFVSDSSRPFVNLYAVANGRKERIDLLHERKREKVQDREEREERAFTRPEKPREHSPSTRPTVIDQLHMQASNSYFFCFRSRSCGSISLPSPALSLCLSLSVCLSLSPSLSLFLSFSPSLPFFFEDHISLASFLLLPSIPFLSSGGLLQARVCVLVFGVHVCMYVCVY